MTPDDRPRRRSRVVVTVVVGLLVWSASLLPPTAGLVQRADGFLLDLGLRLAGPRPVEADIAVVAVDDRDLAALGGWPISRGAWADLIAGLDRAGATTIVLDVLLEPHAGQAGAHGDTPLAGAMARHGNVLLPVGLVDDDEASGEARALAERIAYELVAGEPPATTETRRLVSPASELAEAAAALGPSAVEVSDGGPPALRAGFAIGDVVVPALAVEAVRRHRGEPRMALWYDPMRGAILRGAALAPARDGRYRLLPYGPPAHIRTLPARALLTHPPALKGTLVVAGVSAVAAGQRFRTAFTPALSGPELLATGIANLLESRTLRTVPAASGLALALTLGAAGVAAFALARGRALTSAASAALAVGVLAAGLEVTLMRAAWWLPGAPMLAALVVAGVAIEAIRLVLVQRAERRFAEAERKLARFFPPPVAERLAAAPDAHDLDRTIEATVMFVDIVDSSALVERLAAREAMAELRRFATMVEDAVFAEDGTLIAFLGDGALAAFGAPDPRRDACAAAVRAARRLVAAFADDPLEVGVGLHHGEVLAGVGGGERQFQFTVVGDTVHLASRLQSLSRELDATIVASMAVVARVDDPLMLAGFARRAEQPIRGRAEPLDIAYLPRRALELH